MQSIYLNFFILFGILLSTPSFAQRKTNEYKHELAINAGVQTKGFTVGAYYGKIKSITRTDIYMIDFLELKNIKERRHRQDPLGGNMGFSSYIYGKQNNLYNIRIGAGQRFSISDRTQPKSVALSLQYSAGPTLGLVKPYYLDLMYRDNLGRVITRTEAYSNDNAPYFLDQSSISGPGGGQYGWDDLRIAPGLFAKTALRLDWGSWNELVKALEVGASADFFYKKVPILLLQKNQNLFVNIFINIHFGGRWTDK